MEPLITPPPVPLPPNNSSITGFHKSKVILVLAYIQLGFYVVRFFLVGLMASFSMRSFSPIVFLIPAILIIFTKNKSTYRVARIFLILEYIFVPIALIGLILAFSSAW